MPGQLELLEDRNHEEFRGSEPVPNRFDATANSSEGEKSSTEMSENVNSFAVPNRLPNSSMISDGRNALPKGRIESGTGPLRERESEPLTLSPSPCLGGHAQVPARNGARAGTESGTDPNRLKSEGSASGTARISQQPTLRPYQADAIAAVERELAEHRSTLLVLPTGTGKTVVFAEIARRTVAGGDRVLVLAHRTELLVQAANKLHDVGIHASIDQGQSRGSRHADVVVGSVQTLRGARLERHPTDAFALVIVDEAHHAAATSYRAILERFASAKVLGVTATPDRGDGKALGKMFETVAYTYEMRRAIAEGFLSPLRAKRILVEDLDLSSVRSHHGDFDQGELSQVLNAEAALHGVVGPIVEQAGERPTLVFGVDVAHAKALAEVLNRHKPGRAIALDGTAKAEERAAALALFRRGMFQFLCNCALFTEGFDEPSIACVAMARPTCSRALYTQMLGRGTRLAPGKVDALILDFVGNSGRHRLIGPVDALAGRDLDERIRKIAEANLDGQLELEEILADAERQAAEKKRDVNLLAVAHYREREIDLFLGDLMPAFDPDCAAAKRPATAAQLEAIDAAKLGKPPAGISQAEASAMLEAVRARRSAGLCTIPQARLLERMGCNSKGVAFARASQLIGEIAAKDAWKRPWIALSGHPEFRGGRRA